MSRIFFVVGLLLAFIAGLAAMWFLVSGQRTRAPAAADVVSSLKAPSDGYVAKVQRPVLGALGATISQPYQVWIEGRQGVPQLVFEADKTDGVKIRWTAAQALEVCYADAQIGTFRNRFVDVDRSSTPTTVRTVEVLVRRVDRLEQCPA